MSGIIPWLSLYIEVKLLWEGNPREVQIPQAVAEQDLILRMQETERTSQRICHAFVLFWIVTHGEEYDSNTTEFFAYPLIEQHDASLQVKDLS